MVSLSLQTLHTADLASRHSCVRPTLTSSEMWSQCSISLCRSGCLLMSVSVSGSLCSPSIKYTSSCSRTSEVTWRTMRCNSAVDVRIPISELNETFSYQMWSGFPLPKNQLDSHSVLLCLIGCYSRLHQLRFHNINEESFPHSFCHSNSSCLKQKYKMVCLKLRS